MFAGIVQGAGVVAGLTPSRAGARLRVQARGFFAPLDAGASVAVNGACLTLVAPAEDVGEFDVIPETLRLTSLGALREGARVNLEPSLRVGAPVDGHFVQGHVDECGRVLRVDRAAGEHKLWVAVSPPTRRFIVRKGSVALDGVSLTVVDVEPASFSVALIPTTLSRTTLGERSAGDAINVETDVLARLVVDRLDAWLASGASQGGSLRESLRAAGFVP